MISRPISVYINWSAYDEISDNVELTQDLALRELDEVLRLRRQGARFDYYVMDAYWFANDGGYRTWRTPHWSEGPERWLDRCRESRILPGLWIATNDLGPMTPVPAWEDSVDSHERAMCMFAGGFLPHLMETLHLWYERGVRLYKFDFANFRAVPDRMRAHILPSEAWAANATALRGALAAFRAEHPDCLFLGYNGFDEVPIQGYNRLDVFRAVDVRWLEVFDSLYCGDPRIADIPAVNFWRAKDIYSDHQVRYYQAMGFPLSRIDNAGFMVGSTGTCYYRGAAAWKGMLLLSMARGGWVNTYYGEMERLSDEDAAWFAQAQRLFYPLQARAEVETFGPLPAEGKPYGFVLRGEDGALAAVVNPSQRVAEVELPTGPGRVLFHDAGFTPRFTGDRLSLGPEQMALVGTGPYASAENDLGTQADVRIPAAITPLAEVFAPDGDKALAGSLLPLREGDIRVIFRQTDAKGQPVRTSGGAPPEGTPLDRLLAITAEQDGRTVPVTVHYGKPIWSGLSWAAGEIARSDLEPGVPVRVRFTTAEPRPVLLTGAAYTVNYQDE